MALDLWFPTAIYREGIENADQINSKLIDRIYEIKKTVPSGGYNWLEKTYNTLGTYDIRQDEAFSEILSQVTTHVNHVAGMTGLDLSKRQLVCREAWFNIYGRNDAQEFHTHPGYTYSAVYYVKTPPNSSKLVFESPLEPDMRPLHPMTELHELNYKSAEYAAAEGNVVIFRSYVRHSVPKHDSDEERISIAFNFD
jgi:uncharacterized protein (TIGR02466 family)